MNTTMLWIVYWTHLCSIHSKANTRICICTCICLLWNSVLNTTMLNNYACKKSAYQTIVKESRYSKKCYIYRANIRAQTFSFNESSIELLWASLSSSLLTIFSAYCLARRAICTKCVHAHVFAYNMLIYFCDLCIVYTHVCIRVCMYVCVCVCMYVSKHM